MAIIGRNIIAQPRNPGDMPSWAAQMYGTTRAPMNQNFNGAAVELPGIGSTTPVIGNTQNGAVGVTFDGADMLPGRRVKFGVWYSTTAGAKDIGAVMLMPQFHYFANRHWLEPSSRPWGGQNRAIGEYEDKLLALTVDAPKSVGDYIYIESEPVELPDFMDFQARNAHNSTVNYETPNHEMMWAVAVANGPMNAIRLAAVRVDIETGDEYASEWYSGYIDGSKTDSDDTSFHWTGPPFDSASYAELAITLVEVTPAAPVFTDNDDDGGGSWTTDELEGVIYTPAEGVAAPGETITVTATALDGYVIVGESEWAHTFPDAPPELIRVTAYPPYWTDNDDDGGGSWTTPGIAGVIYTPAEGVAAPGETITVTATPADGYTLEGVTSWAHTFPGAPLPEPEPGAYANTVAGRVATALSVDTSDDEAMDIVLEGANTVIMFAYAYCRGNGFTMTRAGDIVTDKPDITAAIVAGATRYVANPTGLEYRAGTETVSGAFSGWTLAEQAVLNNYRKRWA